MNKQEWLKWRKIGSSDAPVIMGVSPWSTPYQLWESKLSGKTVELNPAMKRGIEMEEMARQCFEVKANVEVFARNVTHPLHSWMTCSLDGIDMNGKTMVEIKCPGKKSHQIAKEGKIPDVYYPQLQHQMEVVGLDHMYYFSFDGEDGVIVEVEKDSAYAADLVKQEHEFYQCLENFTSPELMDRDWMNMDKNKDWIKLSKEWLKASNALKEAEVKEEDLRKQLIALADNKNCRNEDVRLVRYQAKGSVDYSTIPELKDVNLEIYRKQPSTRWRLS